MHTEKSSTGHMTVILAALVALGDITEDEAIAALEQAAHERSMRNTWALNTKTPRWYY